MAAGMSKVLLLAVSGLNVSWEAEEARAGRREERAGWVGKGRVLKEGERGQGEGREGKRWGWQGRGGVDLGLLAFFELLGLGEFLVFGAQVDTSHDRHGVHLRAAARSQTAKRRRAHSDGGLRGGLGGEG